MEIYLNNLLIVTGSIAGLAFGLTWVGAGALITSVLILLFGINPVSAIGTDLSFAAITKIFTGMIHQDHNSIDWHIVKRLWFGSPPAAIITIILLMLNFLDFNAKSLKECIAAVLLVTVFSLLFNGQLQKFGERLRTQNELQFKWFQAPSTIPCDAILGFLFTPTSISAGALGSVILIYLHLFRLILTKLIAADIIQAIPLAIFAGIGHPILSNVVFPIFGWLFLGSILAAYLVAKLAYKLSPIYLSIFLPIVLFSAALKLL